MILPIIKGTIRKIQEILDWVCPPKWKKEI